MTTTETARIETPNGRLFSYEAIPVARKLLIDAGFIVEAGSQSGYSIYLRRPERSDILRLADHDAKRGNLSSHCTVAEIVLADTTRDHVEVEEEYEDADGATFTSEEAVEVYHTGLFEHEIEEIVADAIAEYDSAEEDE